MPTVGITYGEHGSSETTSSNILLEDYAELGKFDTRNCGKADIEGCIEGAITGAITGQLAGACPGAPLGAIGGSLENAIWGCIW